MSVTICIPTYNRKKFEKLIEHNINTQTYFNITEIIILDDGDDEPLCIRTKYPIRYYRVPRCSIGNKRNGLVELSTSKYIAFMDTDDMYDKDYIGYSIFEMETNDKSIAGSADMIVVGYKETLPIFYKQRCMFLHMLNEATLVFKKSLNPQFSSSNSNEAVPFLQKHLGDIIETNIDRLMCCIAHDHNTIPKKQWLDDQYKTNHLSQYNTHLQIISSINV
jgi:glycosyltransferase involved in cell wall biosynthesis